MPAGGNASYAQARKLGAAKMREFSIVDSYKLGYRNREDVTNLPPGVLITGSQNVLTNVSDRIQIRQGYSVDGATSNVISPIIASFDWVTRGNGERNMRAGFITSAGNDGRLQFRYVDSSGNVTWTDLLTGLTSVAFNFATFWNTTESFRQVLFVNGASQIQSWNGALANLGTVDNLTGAISVLNATPTNAGTGYVVGDILTIATGSRNATAVVTSIGGSGAITGVSLLTPGDGYITGSGQATTGGSGTSATLNITTVVTGKIEISGTTDVLDSGFYTQSNRSLVINGHTYTYSGIVGNYFVGISPDASGEAIGSLIFQSVHTVLNSAMSGITSTFTNGLIAVMNNQVFLGSLTSSVLWISKVNLYTDYTSSSTRQAGEGGSLILDENLVGFIMQGSAPTLLTASVPTMYVSAGKDFWYTITFTDFTSVVGASGQTIGALPIKLGKQQGAISQAFMSNMKNNIITVTNETTIDMMGVIENYLTQVQAKNISDSIKLDIDSYDFTDGSIFYFRYYLYVAVPKEGLVLVYNVQTSTWEAPQVLPISRFYIVDDELYGHSYTTSESYQLFTGYADRVYPGFLGFPINAKWVFSYENYGTRFYRKSANYLYVEGYINQNTIATATITYELDGCATTKTFDIDGSDKQIVCIPASLSSLGKQSLGKQKLGGQGNTSIQNLPPKFRVEKSFSNTDFFECSVSFEVFGINNRLELLAYGLNIAPASQDSVSIRQ